MSKIFTSIFILVIVSQLSYAQQPPTYPKVTGYFSIVQPLTTWTKDGFASNFGSVYVVGFPFGINILKSDSFGVSFEVAPAIRTEKNSSKVSTVLFHPGAMFGFKHGFTFIGRMAFEPAGVLG